jgi:hypothetical protein
MYLQQLEANDTLYNAYFWYKKYAENPSFVVTPEFKMREKRYGVDSYCDVCARIWEYHNGLLLRDIDGMKRKGKGMKEKEEIEIEMKRNEKE